MSDERVRRYALRASDEWRERFGDGGTGEANVAVAEFVLEKSGVLVDFDNLRAAIEKLRDELGEPHGMDPRLLAWVARRLTEILECES